MKSRKLNINKENKKILGLQVQNGKTVIKILKVLGFIPLM